MAETKKKSIVFVVALIVLAAMIVVVATALSGCSGNDNSADPTPTETAVPEQTAAPAASNGSAGSIGSAASTGSTGGSSAKQPSASSGSSSTSGSKDNGGSDRNKLEYILNYGDNVEKGMEKSTDDFVKSLENIGNAYDKGDVEGIANTANDFTKGLGDYLGSIRDTIVP